MVRPGTRPTKKDFVTQEGPSWNRQFTANSPHIWIVRAPCGVSGRREIPSELFEVVKLLERYRFGR